MPYRSSPDQLLVRYLRSQVVYLKSTLVSIRLAESRKRKAVCQSIYLSYFPRSIFSIIAYNINTLLIFIAYHSLTVNTLLSLHWWYTLRAYCVFIVESKESLKYKYEWEMIDHNGWNTCMVKRLWIPASIDMISSCRYICRRDCGMQEAACWDKQTKWRNDTLGCDTLFLSSCQQLHSCFSSFHFHCNFMFSWFPHKHIKVALLRPSILSTSLRTFL